MDWKSQTMHGFRCSASTIALLSEILVILLISLQWVELLDGKPRQGIPKCNKKVASRFFASKVLMSCNIFDRTRQVLISSLDSKWKKKFEPFLNTQQKLTNFSLKFSSSGLLAVSEEFYLGNCCCQIIQNWCDYHFKGFVFNVKGWSSAPNK